MCLARIFSRNSLKSAFGRVAYDCAIFFPAPDRPQCVPGHSRTGPVSILISGCSTTLRGEMLRFLLAFRAELRQGICGIERELGYRLLSGTAQGDVDTSTQG